MPRLLPRTPTCPAGREACPVLAELLHLREECLRLRKLSQTDPLTGLYNRRGLLAALDREMERTRRTGLVTSLIMMDLDHFKVFNDTYGHQFGDAVLHRVGLLLMETIRKLDIPCRYGGEEFALILPGTRLPQGVRLAERLRVSLPQVWMAPQDRPEGITASFGVDVYSGKEELTPEAFLQRADRWLLLAKARGRNTVCHPDQRDASREAGLSRRERAAFFLPEDPAAGARGSHG